MSIGAAEPRTRRMSAPERRALVLAAATRAFAKGGYSGTSTDAVAKEAGVSQPYVVRMFGTKADLFHAVFTRALDEIVRTFNDKLDTVTIDPSNPQFWAELGSAYGELVLDRDLLLVMLHGFATSTDDVAAVSSERHVRHLHLAARAHRLHTRASAFVHRERDADQQSARNDGARTRRRRSSPRRALGQRLQRLDCDHAHRRRILERNRHRFLTGHWEKLHTCD
ncbi:AcrR family transcriptional regulator [Rhodococcus sp. OAS809]